MYGIYLPTFWYILLIIDTEMDVEPEAIGKNKVEA